MTGRTVLYCEQFFDRLDQLLPAERSAAGPCSSGDFLVWDLPVATGRLATAFESSTSPLADRPGTFVLVSSGHLVGPFVVYADLLDDGSVEVFWLDIDLS